MPTGNWVARRLCSWGGGGATAALVWLERSHCGWCGHADCGSDRSRVISLKQLLTAGCKDLQVLDQDFNNFRPPSCLSGSLCAVGVQEQLLALRAVRVRELDGDGLWLESLLEAVADECRRGRSRPRPGIRPCRR